MNATPLDTLPVEMQLQIRILTDGSLSTLEEVINQFEQEHELVKELYADFEKSRKVNALMYKLVAMAERLIQQMNMDAFMFFRQPTRDKAEEFSELLEKAKQDLPQLREPPF